MTFDEWYNIHMSDHSALVEYSYLVGCFEDCWEAAQASARQEDAAFNLRRKT